MTNMMLRTCAIVTLIASLGASAPPVRHLNVVATTPDLAALAQAIGGDVVDVKARQTHRRPAFRGRRPATS
jgi:ABC-type Zn uptake system ZnuABC Zn-binding protein ZnuA